MIGAAGMLGTDVVATCASRGDEVVPLAREDLDIADGPAVDAAIRGHRPDVVVNHPATQPSRHAVYYRMNARNRVWVAKRNLPHPIDALYVGTWTAASVLRIRDRENLGVWFRGLVEGVRTDAGPRRPMSWATQTSCSTISPVSLSTDRSTTQAEYE